MDLFTITGTVTLGEGAMSQWEECKTQRLGDEKESKKNYH